jgi:hypothetical protein
LFAQFGLLETLQLSTNRPRMRRAPRRFNGQIVNGISISPYGATFAFGRDDGVLVLACLGDS